MKKATVKTAVKTKMSREAQKIERAQVGGPYGLADRMGVDEVVDPRELRNALLAGLAMTEMRSRG